MNAPVIPGWRLGPVLGEGRLGVVYRCEREGEAGSYAMKVVPVAEPAVRVRFTAEIRALSRLNHPHVCQLLDAGILEDQAWLVMPLAPGKTLLHWRQPPGLPADVVLGVLRQIAEALAHAHARGVLHRDVKPANVVIDSHGHLVLVDFGVAVLDDGAPELSQRQGTPAYSPPEWFRAEPSEDATRDVYALGVLAFELATGAPAYGGRAQADLAEAKATALQLPNRRGAAAVALADLIQATTDPDANRRPTAAALAESLRPWSALPPPSVGTLPDSPSDASGSLWGGEVATGPKIGRYTVIREIGRGSMGVVYLARDPVLARNVAIKRMFATSDAARERFAREARSVARVDHPGAIRVLDFGADSVGPYFAMTHIAGPDLATVLAKGPPPVSRALTWAIAIADALVAAHAAGVVHRDVKPGNVLLEGGERPCLGDFGLAVLADETRLTRADALMGTPAYMAPEQMYGRTIDARTDVYGLGAVLYEMLVGRPPIDGPVLERVLRAPTWEDPAQSALRRPLSRVVAKALEGDPADRYPSMTVFLADLIRVRDGIEPEARGPGPFRWVQRAWRRPATRWGTAALVATIAGLAVPVVGVLRDFLAEQERERVALERALAMEGAVARALEHGDVAAADEAFGAFVAYPLHQGTLAEGDAWLAQARRMNARINKDQRGDLRAAEAWAQAWASARDDVQKRAAVLGLAEALIHAGRLEALSAVVGLGGVSGMGPEWDRIRALQASYARSPEGPLARTGSVDALARRLMFGHRVEDAARTLVLDVDGDDLPELLLADRWIGGSAVLRRGGRWGEAGLPDPWGLPCRVLAGVQLPGQGAVLYTACDGEHVAYAADLTGLRLLGKLPVVPVTRSLVVDLDGDGEGEWYAGVDYPVRDLVRLTYTEAGFSAQVLSPSTSHANSSVSGLAVLDEDPASRSLYVATGAYENYDVRRLDLHGDDLAVGARRQVGNSVHGFAIRGEGGARWMAMSGSPGGAPAFSDESPEVLSEGIYLFDRDFQIVGSWRENPGPCLDPMPADLDGDGTDEILVPCARAMAILDVQGSGRMDATWLGGVTPLTVGDGDGDGDDEVVVHLTVGTDGATEVQTWVLGMGPDRVPPLAVVAPRRPPAGLDAGLRSAWQRAEELAGLGLPEAAEARFDALAVLDPEGTSGELARVRSAELALTRGDVRRATERYARAAERDGADPASLLAAARGYADQLRFVEALDTLSMWERRTGQSAAEVGVDRAGWARASGTAIWDVQLGEPMTAPWRVDRPVGVARRPGTGTLQIRNTGNATLLRVPLVRVGEIVGFDATWRLSGIQAGAGLTLSLEARAQPVLSSTVAARGKSGGTYIAMVAKSGEDFSALLSEHHDGGEQTARQALSWWVEGGRATSALDLGTAGAWGARPMPASDLQEFELVLRGEGSGAGLEAALEGLRLVGLRPAAATSSSEEDARLALFVGDHARVLAADLPPSLSNAVLRAVAHERLGEREAADRALEAAIRVAVEAELYAEVPALIRYGPDRLVDVLRDRLGRRWPGLFAATFSNLGRGPTPAGEEYYRAYLQVLGPLPADPTEEEAPLWADLEQARARALRLAGHQERGFQAAERAVDFARRANSDPAQDHPFGALAQALRELAIHRVSAEPDQAIELLIEAINAAPAREAFADRVSISREFLALRDHPRWGEVLAARRSAYGPLR